MLSCIHKVTKTAVLEGHLEGFDCFPHGLLEQCNICLHRIWLWCDNGWFDGFHSVFECLIGDETWFIFGWGCHGEIGAAGDGTIVVAGVLTVVAAGVVHLFHCYRKLSSAGMSNQLLEVCRKLMSMVAVGGFPWFLLGVDHCFMWRLSICVIASNPADSEA